MGQSLPGSSKSSSVDGQRPTSTQIGFFELLESGSDALLKLFERGQQAPTVEDPKWNSLESPRHTTMTFLEAMHHVALGRDGALDRATKTFGDVDPEDARQTAEDLLHVFDRLPEMSSGSIPGPDIVNQTGIRRLELFPRGIQHDWIYRALDGSPEGSITLVSAEDGAWYFDRSTLEGASELLASVKKIPPRERIARRGNLLKTVLEPTLEQTTAGDWAFFVGVSLAGLAIAWGVAWILHRFKSWRHDNGWLMPLLNGAVVSAWILIVTIAIAIGSARLHFHPTLADMRNALIQAAVVLAAICLAVSLIEMACLGFRRTFYSDDDPYARMMSVMVRRAVRIISGVVIAIFLIQNVFHWNVTALLGGFAIIALALSLAAQDAVKNLFGAFTVFSTRPFMTGDWVRFDGELGTIDDVGLQATKIRLLSGELYSVPNMKFIDSPVENLSERNYLRRVMDVAITYDTPVEKVREGIEIIGEILSSEEVTRDGEGDLEGHPPRVWFDKFGSHYLNLRADYWYMMETDHGDIQRDTERGWFSYLDHATRVNQMVLERFNDAGIDFAFPTQTLYLANDPDRKLKVERAERQEPVS
ncbi:mechanosensitive ion channel domain-containing protein [Roseiconus nitratireducens]|nr:mechanosensitive ion channel domain-containing protein [Roseiconus nitratireducens]